MNIEIKRLTPDLAEDYVDFFDTTPHNDEGNGIKCYCVTWRSDDTYFGNDHWYPTQEERRERAIQFVRSGKIQGYLAYYGNKIVGWCNATADCQKGVDYRRTYWPIEEHRVDIKVKTVFCFMIASEMQRKAHTNKENTAPYHMVFLAMYEKCGFIKYAEREGKVVMRKSLKVPL